MGADVHDIEQARRQREIKQLDEQLARSETGAVIGCLSNLILIIARDPLLSDLCAYDEFAARVVMRAPPPLALDGTPPQAGPYPRGWQPADVALIQSYIQRVWCRRAAKTDTEDAMLAVAMSCRFHPVRDWLTTLKWDYLPRLDKWLAHACGAEDSEYVRAVAAAFLVGAVRRVRRPGVKHDCLPILEGSQGIGKSHALRILASDDWFSDSIHPDLQHKDAAIGLQGKWLLEFSEIEHLIRTDPEILKAYLARQSDWYKPPYARNFVEAPRQCVFAGTTNADDYLRDSTGNRRFWPVRCSTIDLDWLRENRAQLWAEAVYREAQGEPHWLDVPETAAEAVAQQARRQQEDVWEDRVAAVLESRHDITSAELLSDVLHIPVERQTRREQMRVGDILRRAGWRTVSSYDREVGRTRRKWVRGS